MTKQMVIAALEKKVMEEKKEKGKEDKTLIEALKYAIRNLEKQIENHDYEL